LIGAEIFPAMIDAIARARHSVTFVHYHFEEAPVGAQLVDRLAERCRAGVAVKLLLDAFGSRRFPAAYRERMRRAGCPAAFFGPLDGLTTLNRRTHRRSVVVDGAIGFTGGSGIDWEWMGDGQARGHWRDTDVRVEGPVVAELQRAFATQWAEATGERLDGPAYFPPGLPSRGPVTAQVFASDPQRGRFDVHTMLVRAIGAAERSLHITNPYFLPDEAVHAALVAAAGRGVRVVMLVPGPIGWALVRHASRARLGPLLRVGIEIHEYQPGLLHAKTLVVDGAWASVGSANLDNRSFAINAELNLGLRGADIVDRLEQVFAEDLARARPLDEARWRARSVGERLLEILARPIEPYL
jgi:cardiolipin synthase